MIIAAPLWAIAHGLTEGEGAVGQSAKQGYLLFLRAALQPAIMVIAFWLAMVALVPVSQFVAKSFMVFFEGMTHGIYFFMGFLAMVFIDGGLMVGVKTRDVIYALE